MAQDAFPKPVALHGVRKAWVESDVDAWIASRIAARNAEARVMDRDAFNTSPMMIATMDQATRRGRLRRCEATV
jgi:hypothetical protein